MTATIRPAHPRDTAALARLKLATFRETFIDGFAIPYPPARAEDHYLPDLDRILDAVDRTFAY